MQYPHKEPRLIIPSKDAKDQRWYILVYLWDVREGKLRRVRLYLYKDVRNKTEKLRKFERYIDKLIVEISQGLCYDEVTFKQVESNKQLEARKDYMTLSMAITATQRAKEKLRPKTHKNYIFHLNYFKSWLEANNMEGMFVRDFNRIHAEEFLNWVMVVKKLAPRSHNNFKMYLSSMFNYLIDLDIPVKNPFSKIPKLTEGMGKNIAYSKEQQEIILDHCAAKFPQMLPVIYLMYYTFLRPNEICHLQVKHIGMYHRDKIYLPKEFSKNGYERHVLIHPKLLQIFNEMNIWKFPGDFYVFGRPEISPSPKMYTPSALSDRYNRRVLIELEMNNKGNTMYSWKHTGVVRAKLAGMPDAAIMMQAGWREIKSYQTYLKSLGLENNDDFLKMMPEL